MPHKTATYRGKTLSHFIFCNCWRYIRFFVRNRLENQRSRVTEAIHVDIIMRFAC